MGKLVFISLVLLFGCNYKTEPTTEGDYKACVEYSKCHTAVGACIFNDTVAKGITLREQEKRGFPTYCIIQSQLCKKRCLQCVAHPSARGSSKDCNFNEFKILYLDSEGLY